MVFELPEDEIVFPQPQLADEDGLLAVGGSLTAERLLLAYSHGIFPWYSFRDVDRPMWYCPHERFVIFPREIHISHSMRSLINKHRYRITINHDFEAVIHGCSEANGRVDSYGAWLGTEMISAYTELHRLQFAASVEVWDGQTLVGGLYGVTLGNCFMGESMFSRVPSASKLALIALAQRLQPLRDSLIDCQFETPHLKSMGGRMISYDDYMMILNKTINY